MHKIQVHQSRPQTLNKQEILRTSTSFDCCNASFCIEPRPTFLSTYWQLQTKHFPWKDLFHTSHELHWKLRGMEREMGCRYIRIIIQDHQAYKSFVKTWVKWDVRPFAKIPTCFQALHSAFSTHHVAHQPAASASQCSVSTQIDQTDHPTTRDSICYANPLDFIELASHLLKILLVNSNHLNILLLSHQM